jgi:hypothetical protein
MARGAHGDGLSGQAVGVDDHGPPLGQHGRHG